MADDKYEVESEHERAVENNANVIRNAAKVATVTDIPEAVVAGEVVTTLDKATGGASTEIMSEMVTDNIEQSPFSGEIQSKLNMVSESGVADAAGAVSGLANPTSASGAIETENVVSVLGDADGGSPVENIVGGGNNVLGQEAVNGDFKGGLDSGIIDGATSLAGDSNESKSLLGSDGDNSLGTSPNGYGAGGSSNRKGTDIPDNKDKDGPRNRDPKSNKNGNKNDKDGANGGRRNPSDRRPRRGNNGKGIDKPNNNKNGYRKPNGMGNKPPIKNDNFSSDGDKSKDKDKDKDKNKNKSNDEKNKNKNKGQDDGKGKGKGKGPAKGKKKSKADEVTEELKKEVKKKVIATITASSFGCFILLFGLIILLVIIIAVTGGLAADDDDNSTGFNGMGNGECGFTISATSLSRDEFIKSVTDYAKKNNMNKDFIDRAGDIYDEAKLSNVNPELVIIRAIAESKGNTTTGTNNYWGIGCTNQGKGKDCKNYSTFMEGVSDYVSIVSKYNTLNDMMSHYSYLGDYWYNPGDAGTGGCYYAKYMYEEIPARVQSACASDKKCSDSKCVKTTDEEKETYTKWQVENMGEIRQNVFGLRPDEGVACAGGGNGNYTELSSYNLKHQGLNILSRTLSASEIENINNYVNSQVQSAGYGTGAAVAMAGQSLVHALSQSGFYLGYCWGGDRTSLGAGKSWGKRSSSCNSPGKSHRYYGMDCSGFVSWSIRNACKSNFGASTARGFVGYGSSTSIKNAQPGDLMASSSHVRLIVKNNGDGSIIVAEESGSADGLIFNKYSSAGSYKIVSMSSWYSKNCKK